MTNLELQSFNTYLILFVKFFSVDSYQKLTLRQLSFHERILIIKNLR